MAQEWMIDVLADLRQYAVRNYHFRLAEQLDDAIVTAAIELGAGDLFEDEPDAIPRSDTRLGHDGDERNLALIE